MGGGYPPLRLCRELRMSARAIRDLGRARMMCYFPGLEGDDEIDRGGEHVLV